MGAGMNKILPGLYLGSIRDSKDQEQLKKHNITHILSIYDDPKNDGLENIEYLRFKARDHASQDLKQYFHESIDFIHSTRLKGGNVLVHCLAGVSRSATLVISYIMTITEMPWYDSLNVVRGAREQANPNFGFQRQLQNFEFTTLKSVREDVYKKYGLYDNSEDLSTCKMLLESYHKAQKQFMSDSSNQQVNYSPFKTYPLGYNAYNLDDEKPLVDPNLKNIKTEDYKTNQSINAETNNNEEMSEEEKQKEKDKIMEKLFG